MAAWLRVESFRRFLAGSESAHAEEAARRGVVREYTAWAVALDQLDRWSRAVAVATGTPEGDASFAALASRLPDPLHDAASYSGGGVSGSSAGGGGGDGVGAVGGGQGGGGGGSW